MSAGRGNVQKNRGSGARLLGVEGRPLGAPVEGHVDAAHDERRTAEQVHAGQVEHERALARARDDAGPEGRPRQQGGRPRWLAGSFLIT